MARRGKTGAKAGDGDSDDELLLARRRDKASDDEGEEAAPAPQPASKAAPASSAGGPASPTPTAPRVPDALSLGKQVAAPFVVPQDGRYYFHDNRGEDTDAAGDDPNELK